MLAPPRLVGIGYASCGCSLYEAMVALPPAADHALAGGMSVSSVPLVCGKRRCGVPMTATVFDFNAAAPHAK